MKKLADRVNSISISTTVEITALAQSMKANGEDIISLAPGELDFSTPNNISESAIDAIKTGKTRYTSACGSPQLINAIKNKFKKDNNIEYSKEEIIVSSGAKHSIFNALLALIDNMDEIIIPSPSWVTYPEIVKFLGGIPILLNSKVENSYKLSIKQIKGSITNKTKAIILNSPCNPSGAVYSLEELQEIADLCIKNDIYVISDEIYEKIIYNNTKHISIASLNSEIFSRTITINGVSKSNAMTGWRIGYLGAPIEIAKAIAKIQGQTTHHPSTISMEATITACTDGDADTTKMLDELIIRRKLILEKLMEIPNIICPEPLGAFYVFPDVSFYYGKKAKERTINDSLDLSKYLLEEYGVATIPGIAFGEDKSIRLSFSTSKENITEALKRIKKAFTKLN